MMVMVMVMAKRDDPSGPTWKRRKRKTKSYRLKAKV
jgi:hypothetical protein